MIPTEAMVYETCRERGSHAMRAYSQRDTSAPNGRGRFQVCADCRVRYCVHTGYSEQFDILPSSIALPLRH